MVSEMLQLRRTSVFQTRSNRRGASNIAPCCQEETLRQKAGVLAVIEELGKLEPLLAEAAAEEVLVAKQREEEKERKRAERRAAKEAETAAKQVCALAGAICGRKIHVRATAGSEV